MTTSEVNHSERKHSMLGPSSAHRWARCLASNNAIRSLYEANPEMEESSSVYALEGTCAHEVADLLLSGNDPSELIAKFEKEYAEYDFDYDAMLRFGNSYLAYIEAILIDDDDAKLYGEHRLTMHSIHEDCFGTGDATVILPNEKEIHVVDYKYGKGVVVSAENNLQIAMYAVGAIETILGDVDTEGFKIIGHIFQPRVGNYSTWDFTSALPGMIEELREAARKSEDNYTDFNPGESQCKFCEFKTVCKPHSDWVFKGVLDDFEVETEINPTLFEEAKLSHEDLGKLLKKVKLISEFVSDVNSFCKKEALVGRPPVGFKLVAGRSSYSFDETKKDELHNLVGDDMFKPRAVKSKTEIGKIKALKDSDNTVDDFFIKREGAPTLVEESDKRDAINIGGNIDDDFD